MSSVCARINALNNYRKLSYDETYWQYLQKEKFTYHFDLIIQGFLSKICSLGLIFYDNILVIGISDEPIDIELE